MPIIPIKEKEKLDGSHASILFELKKLIYSRVGFVIRSYVVGSIFRKSPPYIRGDFAIDHKVICETKIHSFRVYYNS